MMQKVMYKNATLTVQEGDVTQIPAQAIATLINSGGLWFGGIDGAIQRVSGNFFYEVPQSVMMYRGLHDGDVIVASESERKGWYPFGNVIFVVDDLKRQLNDLVFAAVQEAYQLEYESLSLPLMRTGVMKNVVEPVKQVPAMMVNGIKRAVDLYERPITINVVAYHDNVLANAVLAEMQRLGER